jgi:hypothetical protein
VWRQHAGNGEIDDDEDGHGGDDDDEASGSGMGPTTTGTVSCQDLAVIRLINWRYNSAWYIAESKIYCRMVSTCSIEKYRFVYVCIRCRKIHAWYRSALLCDNMSNKGEIYLRWIAGIDRVASWSCNECRNNCEIHDFQFFILE